MVHGYKFGSIGKRALDLHLRPNSPCVGKSGPLPKGVGKQHALTREYLAPQSGKARAEA